jgi:probable rRNA maturation factor
MTVVVDVADASGLVAGHDAVRALVEAVLEAEGVSGEVSVAFVDEPSIAELNGRYREVEGSTDVLAFDYAADAEWPGQAERGGQAGADGPAEDRSPAESGAVSGEVLVCPQVVMRYAAEEGREAIIQLGWTLIHGTLHLAGYDHETDQGEMREREQELLRRLGGRVQALTLTASGG